MSMKPEEYLQAQSFAASATGQAQTLSSAEQAFINKYVGSEALDALNSGQGAVTNSSTVAMPGLANQDTPSVAYELPLVMRLKAEQTVQMVSFYLDSQVYLIPTLAVNEVLRYVEPVLLPMAPDYVAGVINLRGKVTPLIYLENILTTPRIKHEQNRFIIICTYKDLQVGLIFDKVHTMYTFRQEQIMWDVESRIGASAEYICGLVDVDERILGVVAVDMIIDQVLQD